MGVDGNEREWMGIRGSIPEAALHALRESKLPENKKSCIEFQWKKLKFESVFIF